LPEFPAVNVEEVQKIMELTGLDKKLDLNGTAVKEQEEEEAKQ